MSCVCQVSHLPFLSNLCWWHSLESLLDDDCEDGNHGIHAGGIPLKSDDDGEDNDDDVEDDNDRIHGIPLEFHHVYGGRGNQVFPFPLESHDDGDDVTLGGGIPVEPH